MKILAIIPARYGSSRFPGKPLADIAGKPMIQRVYEQTKKAFDYVYVATDDFRIYDRVVQFKGQVVMTSEDHQSGTDRCFEALKKVEELECLSFDIIINVQGDEPFIEPEQLKQLVNCFEDPQTQIATLVKRFLPGEDIFNENSPKVIISNNNNAIYFSRAAIPFQRDTEKSLWSSKANYYKHIGLYAYKRAILEDITKMTQSLLENCEKLEQLRWLENGINIKVAETNFNTHSIDTPEDLAILVKNTVL